jgi:hypothetical protein
VAVDDRELAAAHLTQRTRVLAGSPDRRIALHGEGRLIKHQHAITQDGFGQHFLHPLAVEVVFLPLHVREELLQALFARVLDGLGNVIAVLVAHFGKQPGYVPL